MSIFVLGFDWGCGNKGEYLLPPTLCQLCQNRCGTGFKQGDLCFIIIDYNNVHREGAKWTRAQKRTECWWLGEGTATRKTQWLWWGGEGQSNRWQERDGRSKEPFSLGFQKEKSLQRYCNWVDDRGAVSMEHPTTGSLWQQPIPSALFMKTKQGFTSMESLRMTHWLTSTVTDKPKIQCMSEAWVRDREVHLADRLLTEKGGLTKQVSRKDKSSYQAVAILLLLYIKELAFQRLRSVW